jgi:hypothetical protein
LWEFVVLGASSFDASWELLILNKNHLF